MKSGDRPTLWELYRLQKSVSAADKAHKAITKKRGNDKMELYYCTVTRELLTLETLRLEYNKFYDGEMSFCEFFDMITDMGGDVRPVDPETMMYRPDDNTVEDIDLIDENDMENYVHIADYFCDKEKENKTMKKTIAQLNQETADRLDRMNLSAHARDILNQTDINLFYELFGDLETAADVENFVSANYPKYFLDDGGDDHWTLYRTADREEICSVYGPGLDGYENNWQKALEDFFCEKYGIEPEEWEIG